MGGSSGWLATLLYNVSSAGKLIGLYGFEFIDIMFPLSLVSCVATMKAYFMSLLYKVAVYQVVWHTFCTHSISKSDNYGYTESQANRLIVHTNFKTKRRWTKETNFGDVNNRIGYSRLACFFMLLMGVALSVKTAVVMNILTGSNWLGKSGRRFTKLRVLRVVAVCVGVRSIIVGSINGRLCALLKRRRIECPVSRRGKVMSRGKHCLEFCRRLTEPYIVMA